MIFTEDDIIQAIQQKFINEGKLDVTVTDAEFVEDGIMIKYVEHMKTDKIKEMYSHSYDNVEIIPGTGLKLSGHKQKKPHFKKKDTNDPMVAW